MKLLKLGEHLDYLVQGTILSLTERGVLWILKQSIYAELQISQKKVAVRCWHLRHKIKWTKFQSILSFGSRIIRFST